MSDGILELSDIQTMIASMHDNAVAEPEYFIVSPKIAKRIKHLQRLAQLYASVLPRPSKRRLRKAAMRSIQKRLKQGRQRIRRRERIEEQFVSLCSDALAVLINDAMRPRPPAYDEDQAWWLNAIAPSPPRSVALHDENGEVVGWQHTFTLE